LIGRKNSTSEENSSPRPMNEDLDFLVSEEQEPILSETEVQEAKLFIEKCVEKILEQSVPVPGAEEKPKEGESSVNPEVNNESSSLRDEKEKYFPSGAILTDEDCDKLHFYFKTEPGRRFFAEALNNRRSGNAVTFNAFEVLWRLVKVALIRADMSNDYADAKTLMHMAATYFRIVDGVYDYIQSRLKSIEIWRKGRFWDYALYDSVAQERGKAKPELAKSWAEMSEEEQQDHNNQERSIFFGQLGSFAMHMLSLDLSIEEVRAFVSKQCHVNDLNDEQRDALLGNLYALSTHLEEQDVDRERKLNKQQEGETQEKSFKGEFDKAKKKQQALQSKAFDLSNFIRMWDNMKVQVDSNSAYEESLIKRQFGELRHLINQKEKEVLENYKQKKKEALHLLDLKVIEIVQLKANTLDALSDLDGILTITDPNDFLVASDKLQGQKHFENQLTVPQDLSKSNQHLVREFGYFIDTKDAKSYIEKLGIKDKLCVARWKIEQLSGLEQVEREYSTIFRLYGFNWRLMISQKMNPDYLSFYLEFMDGANAIGWSLRVQFIMRIWNQKKKEDATHSVHEEEVKVYEFGGNADTQRAGFPEFMALKKFNDLQNGWILDDSVIFEVEFVELQVLEHGLK